MQRLVRFLQEHWEGTVQIFVEDLEAQCNAGVDTVLDWIPTNVARPLCAKFKRMAAHRPLYVTVEGLLCEVGRGLRAVDPSEPFRRHYVSAYGEAPLLRLSSDEQYAACMLRCQPHSSDVLREWVAVAEFEVQGAHEGGRGGARERGCLDD